MFVVVDGGRRDPGLALSRGRLVVAAAEGLGHERASPEARRVAFTFANILEPGDPIAYARAWTDEPFAELTGEPRNVLLLPTPGDPIVNINTGARLRRGLRMPDEVDDRYGEQRATSGVGRGVRLVEQFLDLHLALARRALRRRTSREGLVHRRAEKCSGVGSSVESHGERGGGHAPALGRPSSSRLQPSSKKASPSTGRPRPHPSGIPRVAHEGQEVILTFPRSLDAGHHPRASRGVDELNSRTRGMVTGRYVPSFRCCRMAERSR